MLITQNNFMQKTVNQKKWVAGFSQVRILRNYIYKPEDGDIVPFNGILIAQFTCF